MLQRHMATTPRSGTPVLGRTLDERNRLATALMRVRLRAFRALQKVSGAVDSHRASVENMGVDHGGVQIAVPHQFLDRADVLSTLQQMGGVMIPETNTARRTAF